MAVDPEPALYPIQLYIYNRDGMHDEPIEIVSYEQLLGPGTQLVVRHAVYTGLEVVMTDPQDRCLFHAKHGKVLFPECNNPPYNS